MVGPGTVGNESTKENSVYVPRQIISKDIEKESGYAYWVGDEGVKTRVAGAKQLNLETNLDHILNVNNADSPRLDAMKRFSDVEDISDQSDKILTIGTAQFAFNEALGGNIDAFKNKFHSLSAFSRGLMVDVKHGGIRKDLSLLLRVNHFLLIIMRYPYLLMIIQKVLIGITPRPIIIYIKKFVTMEVEIISKQRQFHGPIPVGTRRRRLAMVHEDEQL